jgi:ribose transport system permease protein
MPHPGAAAMLRRAYPVLVLAFTFTLAWLLSPARPADGASLFTTPENLLKILRQVSEFGLLALGETVVILAAGIDLSLGSALGLSSMLTAYLLVRADAGAGVAVAGGLAAGLACGLVNGFLTVGLRLQAFIATLATAVAARGAARLLTGNASIAVDESHSGFLALGRSLGPSSSLGAFVTAPSVTFLAAGAAMVWVLTRTTFGRSVYAIGGNAEAARLAGIPVGRRRVATYAIAGLLAGLAGAFHCAQLEQSSPMDGDGYELRAIAAVAIGGTLLTGGRGGAFATTCGVLTLGILSSILGLRNVPAETQLIAIAATMVVAVKFPEVLEWLLRAVKSTPRASE